MYYSCSNKSHQLKQCSSQINVLHFVSISTGNKLSIITGIQESKNKNILINIQLKLVICYACNVSLALGFRTLSIALSILLIHCYQHQIPCNRMTSTTVHTHTGVYCTLHIIDYRNTGIKK